MKNALVQEGHPHSQDCIEQMFNCQSPRDWGMPACTKMLRLLREALLSMADAARCSNLAAWLPRRLDPTVRLPLAGSIGCVRRGGLGTRQAGNSISHASNHVSCGMRPTRVRCSHRKHACRKRVHPACGPNPRFHSAADCRDDAVFSNLRPQRAARPKPLADPG